jgi:isoleucyl-tRNA synthetase
MIYRQRRPVYWSPSSLTALAEGELEYNKAHKSTAAFIKLRLAKVPSELQNHAKVDLRSLGALIWTTSPWTMPANEAVAVNPDIKYAVIESPEHGQLLVAQSRISSVAATCFGSALPGIVLQDIPGHLLAGRTEYVNPIRSADSSAKPVIAADFVKDASGTGLVHCAPAHGMEDYEACQRHGIAAIETVDDKGRFTSAAFPSDPEVLVGKPVLTGGSAAVLAYLRQHGFLVCKHKFQHSYPYDWRTKLPVIIRATEQWFARVEDVKQAAMEALSTVRFLPPSGRSRLESFVQSRSEWCISRQRSWGVPIPALYHRDTGVALLTPDSVTHIISVIERRGIDAWWTDALDDPAWTPPSLRQDNGTTTPYLRGKDTMDVWFDSGTSWTQMAGGVSDGRKLGQPLADLYLEGTDQHRGWFQSSLLTYIACQRSSSRGGSIQQPRAPFKMVITHGFTLDAKGRKMSKSDGNVIPPDAITDGLPLNHKNRPMTIRSVTGERMKKESLGPDALRLWVACCDYTKDLSISEAVIKTVHADLTKLRLTFKWLLGVLDDFRPDLRVEYSALTSIDRIALLQLSQLNENVLAAFKAYEFTKGEFPLAPFTPFLSIFCVYLA